MIFMICLTQQPKKLSLSLTANIINKQMVQLWHLHWVQRQLTFSYAILKLNGVEIVLIISNLFYRCYIDDLFVLFSSPDHADNPFFREYNISFKKPFSPVKVVYHLVSCLLHLLTHVITKRVPIITNFKRPIYQTLILNENVVKLLKFKRPPVQLDL